MMKKGVILLSIVLFSLTAYAQSQVGIVRTSGTAKKKGVAIPEVILRAVGGNDVMSGADGRFSMVLQQRLDEGDSFQLSKVFKKGYEPIDRDILKRHFVYSKTVPIEIVLISSKQLMKDKTSIEKKARNNAEKRFRKKISAMKAQLDAQQISSSDYQKQAKELERQMQAFEVLIAAMADHYARTDYDRLDSLNAIINEYIINGELEKADSLINTKGDVRKRAHENITKGMRLRAAEEYVDSMSDVINERRKKY